MICRTSRHLASPTNLFATKVQSYLKPVQTGLSRKNRDEWDGYAYNNRCIFWVKYIHSGIKICYWIINRLYIKSSEFVTTAKSFP
jgi:hypothetical protein